MAKCGFPEPLEGFDVTAAVERMLGQPALWWQALDLFTRRFAEWEAEWRQTAGNDAAERKRVHALRSAAVTVGAMRLAGVAEELEARLLRRLAGESVLIDAASRQALATEFRRTLAVACAALLPGLAGEGEGG